MTAPREPSRSAPSAEEAAAIVAAVERFLRDRAAAPPAAPAGPDPWRRAALLEGVSGRIPAAGPHPWINT